ncbi:helix-turn-helix domain-containing protein [Chryseobacterium sp. CT-SW4]|uniref:helix-turn-helix domain-containing protein n=1 Tax=Chryseobacterium sp. SW-1 TaxID=3157343 RepID=UPI003B0105D0
MIPLFKHVEVPENSIIIINLFALVSILYLFVLGSYFNKKINVLNYKWYKNKELTIYKKKPELEVDEIGRDEDRSSNNDARMEKLYEDILIYFEEQKPFCNNDFSMIQLANALDTNVTYISRAIKLGANTNFNAFVNNYRIDFVKKLIDDEELKNYSMLHIFTSAGFKYQSTFNKVFKQVEGVTPTEYIRNSKKHKITQI